MSKLSQHSVFIILTLLALASSQRLFYFVCADGNAAPGIFVFGEGGNYLNWFAEVNLAEQLISTTAIFNHLDGLFYTQTYVGYQIDNPATGAQVATIDAEWNGFSYGINVLPIDKTQFLILSGTPQGLYAYNSKFGNFSLLSNASANFDAIGVSPITNQVYIRDADFIYEFNMTDNTLQQLVGNLRGYQILGDPTYPNIIYFSHFGVGVTDAVKTYSVADEATEVAYYRDTATFTLSPDGFSYSIPFCCVALSDWVLRRHSAIQGLPFAPDNNFIMDPVPDILDIANQTSLNIRYMTVLWAPPRVDPCLRNGLPGISMQFKRYNWTGTMELQVANLFEPVFQTVVTVTPDIIMDENVTLSFALALYRNTSTLYRVRVKYIGIAPEWPGYSVHRELALSLTTFSSISDCPTDVLTISNPPIATPLGVTPTTPISTPVEAPTNNNEAGTIVPAVVVPTVVVAAVIVFVVLWLKRKEKRKTELREEREEMQDTGYTALPIDPSQKKEVIATTNPVNLSSKIDRMNIPRDNLVIGTEIGQGSYGRVHLGEWNSTTVAIKVATTAGTAAFNQELELMLHLTPHPNVLQILGYSYDGVLPLLVLEYCGGGGLDKIVLDQSKPLTAQQQLNLIAGIARGILHLHNNNVVHRDLAARNVLLSTSGEPKVSDFGFSRVVQTAGGQTKSTIGPVLWMAPESLKEQSYSFKTDVWSFGIMMFEILAREEPHKGQQLLDVGPRIRDEGLTPDISLIDQTLVSPGLVEIMKQCWAMNPDQRPNFSEICAQLDALRKRG